MRRALWEMPDNEIAALLDRAIMVLDELYVRLAADEDQVDWKQKRRDAFKKRSVEWHRYDTELYFAKQHLALTEQRIAAQETVVQAFRNESAARNPPFWTRSDLDRINRQR